MTYSEEINHPRPQLALVVQHFFEGQAAVVDRAGREFFDYVQACQDLVPKDKIEQLFREWFVFDFLLKTGKTALETYIYRNPDDLDRRELDLLQQASDSAFTAHFWLGQVDLASQLLQLEDCRSTKQYPIRDATAVRHVTSNVGWIAARMIQLDGDWHFASDPLYYAAIAPTASMKQRMQQAAQDRPFIDIVKMHYGLHDRPFEELQIIADR
ncbi:MAG: hypothetical protein FWF11_01555 [Coriobacteriia bacterium]|nr:hypothetical protein [Coriobacteriia bacterium]